MSMESGRVAEDSCWGKRNGRCAARIAMAERSYRPSRAELGRFSNEGYVEGVPPNERVEEEDAAMACAEGGVRFCRD